MVQPAGGGEQLGIEHTVPDEELLELDEEELELEEDEPELLVEELDDDELEDEADGGVTLQFEGDALPEQSGASQQ